MNSTSGSEQEESGTSKIVYDLLAFFSSKLLEINQENPGKQVGENLKFNLKLEEGNQYIVITISLSLSLSQFETIRSELIFPFIEKNREQAFQLAERFQDFSSLLALCESSDKETNEKEERLAVYLSTVENFSNFLFSNYLMNGM